MADPRPGEPRRHGHAQLHGRGTALGAAGQRFVGRQYRRLELLRDSRGRAGQSLDLSRVRQQEDTVTVNFEFPELDVNKTTTAPGFPDIADANVGQSFGWRIVVTNQATTAVAVDTVVGDTLPPDWTYDAGSTTITGAPTAEPSVVTDPGGDILTWDFTGQTIQPGATVTITFTAKPDLAAKANPPGTDEQRRRRHRRRQR